MTDGKKQTYLQDKTADQIDGSDTDQHAAKAVVIRRIELEHSLDKIRREEHEKHVKETEENDRHHEEGYKGMNEKTFKTMKKTR